MKNFTFTLALLIAVLPFLSVRGNDSGPVIVVQKTNTPPVIDGDDSDPCWKNALKLTPLMKFNPSGKVEPASLPKTEVKLIIGEKGIYIFANFSEPEIKTLTIKEHLSRDKSYSSQIWLEDHWEAFIQPLGGKDNIQLMGDPKGRGTERKGRRESKITASLASKTRKDSWTMELLIPASLLNVDFKKFPAFRFNFYRVRRANTVELLCWAPVKKRFSDLPRFGWLVSESLDKNIEWLNRRFLKKEQQDQLKEAEKIFKHLNIQGQTRKNFDDIVKETALLKQNFEKIPAERWKKIASSSENLPERLKKQWETAKLMEIVR